MHQTAGFVIALVGTTLSHAGFALLKRGASGIPQIKWPLRLAVLRQFLRCKIWLIGTGFQFASFIAYAVAISLAPVSIVQPVTSAGILVLVFLAIVYLKERLSAAESASIALIIAGLLALGVSLSSEGQALKVVPHVALLLFSLGSLAAAGLVLAAISRIQGRLDWGIGLGMLTGVLYGISTLVMKGLTTSLKPTPRPWTAIIVYAVFVILLNSFPYVMMQAAFQRGRAATVVPTMSALTAALPVVGGMWVFSERLPSSTALATARMAGTVAIVVGAVALSRFGPAPDEEPASTDEPASKAGDPVPVTADPIPAAEAD